MYKLAAKKTLAVVTHLEEMLCPQEQGTAAIPQIDCKAADTVEKSQMKEIF